MSTQQRIVLVAVFLVAVVGSGLAFALLGGGGGGGASPSPSGIAAASDSPAPASTAPAESAVPTDPPSPSTEPSTPPSTEPSPSASSSASPSPSPTPTPTVAPGRPTVAVLTGLKLDAKDDPDGRNRRIIFRSQGTGTISVAIRTLSPQGSTVACLSADGVRLACRTAASGTLTAETTSRRADFLVTLRGEGIETPVVEVTVTFPSNRPELTIENARFDGTLYPETNGLQLLVSPREDGEIGVTAEWGGHPFNYEIDLFEQGGPGTQVLANQGPSTGVDTAIPVTAGNPWKLVLQNVNEGFGITGLDATIRWP